MVSKIKLSYHRRLFLILIAFTWTIIVCFIVFQYLREKQFKSEFINERLQNYNIELLESLDLTQAIELKIDTNKTPFENIRISVISFSGEVLYDNLLPYESLENHDKRPEIISANQNGKGYHIARQSESDGKEYFYSATKGKNIIIRTAVPYSNALIESLKADLSFLWVMIVVGIVMSVIAYFITHRLGKTIERLNLFAEKAKKGEPFDNEKPFPKDELGSISNHIVQLYAQWQQTIKDRNREYETAIREEQEKNRIKRQLTNNINHELKTPVASIQICLETLLSGMKLSEEKQQELIERCYTNSDRLRRLLNDVSLITRMEDGSQLFELEEMSVNDIINEVADEMSIQPENERMNLSIDFTSQVNINGNPSLIGFIFRNLTDNAISYSGGKNIYIKLLENTKEYCKIRFEDDGKGVDESQLPHLFERFYRVDKGRSRKLGGTGLGLAIVKHSVLFHGGAVSVVNRPEGGLRFDFTLKKNSINR